MRHHRDRAGNRRQSKQRHFLQQQPRPFVARVTRRVRAHRAGLHLHDPPEGPIIQQQQKTRDRDEHRFAHQAEGHGDEHQGVAGDAGSSRVCLIRQQGQHPEEGAQYVLPFRNPGHGIHLQRMQRKKTRHHRAPPGRAGHPPQSQKQQQDVGGVEQQIGEMMPPSLETKELAVQHV